MRRVMTHVVGGFPDNSSCLELLCEMQQAGASAIEIQIPFSDPTADGPVIMQANDIALRNSTTVDDCLEIVRMARGHGVTIPLYIMSYVNKLHSYSIGKFCKAVAAAGASGLIIPDLPYDTQEYELLTETCRQFSLEIVPVLSVGITARRLEGYLHGKPKLAYITSQHGTTGGQLTQYTELPQTVEKVRQMLGCEIAIGFGLSTAADVSYVLGFADMAVIGSEVIRRLQQDGQTSALRYISTLTNGV